MLSYRHGFHAGNHADVLKHALLLEIINYFNQKDKSFCYVDTHAGAGLYTLTDGYATKNAEHETGISRLWQATDLPPMLQRYIHQIKEFNPKGDLKFYPGSPMLAHKAMRPGDPLRLFELHPNDYKSLAQNCASLGRWVQVSQNNGFNGLKAVLPPQSRRGLILIDPPYEEKQDYKTVIKAIQSALTRFATGSYLIWYPCLQRHEGTQMIESLKQIAATGNWLHVALNVQKPSEDGFGMFGSGLFILNQPWTLFETLKETLPYLTNALAIDDSADFILEHQQK